MNVIIFSEQYIVYTAHKHLYHLGQQIKERQAQVTEKWEGGKGGCRRRRRRARSRQGRGGGGGRRGGGEASSSNCQKH